MDNIEDIYYNKYLKYKYKYLELKGKGIFGKSEDEKKEEKLYGPELLEEIKNDISISKKNIENPSLLNRFFMDTSYERSYDLYAFTTYLITTLEHMVKVQQLAEFSTEIINIININRLIVDDNMRKEGYMELNNKINKVFEKNKHLSTFPILKKLFDLYYKTISLYYKTIDKNAIKKNK